MQVVSIPLPEQTLKRRRGNPSWKKGQASANPNGRPKGSVDKFTREIKQALLDAVEHVGEAKAEEFFTCPWTWFRNVKTNV
jgi:Family of unknown function (DUF5681)